MSGLFKAKSKNLITIIFTAVYTVMLILNIDFPFQNLQNTRHVIAFVKTNLIPLVPPVFVFIYLLTVNREYKFKKWLFPIAIGTIFVEGICSLYYSFASIDSIISSPLHLVMLLCSCLMFVAVAFMFVGTLLNFKYGYLLKYGALICAVLTFAVLILDFIAVGGFEYLQSVPSGYSTINIFALLLVIARILFYTGIFIFTTKKVRA